MASTRILVVADDPDVGRWLQELLELQPQSSQIAVEDNAAFDQRPVSSTAGSFDLLVSVLDFSPESSEESLAWIERALAPPGAPPLLVVADNGIAVDGHVPQWRSFVSPRKDRLLVYRRR